MSDLRKMEDQILTALRLALAEGYEGAAEHLFRALEALCADASPGSPLADGYLTLAGERTQHRSARN